MADRIAMAGEPFIPEHLEHRVRAMRERLQGEGGARPTRAGEPLPEWFVSFEGARCAVMLEDLFDGFAHLPGKRQPHEISWARASAELPLDDGEASTFSFGMITRLTLLSHEHVIRAALRATQLGGLVLELTPATPGRWHQQHPTLEDLQHEVRRARQNAQPIEGPTFVLLAGDANAPDYDDDDSNTYARMNIDELADRAVELEADDTDITHARWVTGLYSTLRFDLEEWLDEQMGDHWTPSNQWDEQVREIQTRLDALVGGFFRVDPMMHARLPHKFVQSALERARLRASASTDAAQGGAR